MTICVGLIGHSDGWEELLRQEGVPFGSVRPGESTPGLFSAIVACRKLTIDEAAFLREYLRAGGALLGCSVYLTELFPRERTPVRLKYLRPDGEPGMPGLSLMDVETEGIIPAEANLLRSDQNLFAVFGGEFLGGYAVIAPFDPGRAFEDIRATERYFYASVERLPSERVSSIGKGEILHFLHAALEYLHHERGYFYAHLAYFPTGHENIFAFRIDTDGGTREEIDELSDIARNAAMSFTWFLDVRSHEQWLERFSTLSGHEIGLHCYDHRVFLDRAKDTENIQKGRERMESHGLSVRSFAAPFGFWSPDVGRMIDDAGFAYSSEFSWAYDTLPNRPVSGGVRFRTLQVPVHPVSIGNLRRVGCSSGHMSVYYKDVVDRKLARREPLFFYHHPGHREWDVVRRLCDGVRERGIRSMTMAEYAAWWERRGAAHLRVSVIGTTSAGDGTVEATTDSTAADPDVSVRLSRQGGEESFVQPGGSIRSDALSWKAVPVYRAPEDIRRMREFDMRGEIGRQVARLQRGFR